MAANWEILGVQPSAAVAQMIIEGMDGLRGPARAPDREVWGCIEKLRGQGGPTAPESPDNLMDAEWRLLSRPTTERQVADFRALPTDSPRGYASLIDQVILVSRLREVRALLGFTPLAAPERDGLRPVRRIRSRTARRSGCGAEIDHGSKADGSADQDQKQERTNRTKRVHGGRM